MRVNKDGQVTIPKAIRDLLGLHPHTEIKFVVEGDGLRIVKLESRRGERALQFLRDAGPLSMSTDEIMALTRGS